MLTRSTRRKPGAALAVLTVLMSLTGLAQAQQGGLFPLSPIQRERTPCPAEQPIYKLYRSQYYGYYPPQWRPFPQGWHLKSPETPNRERELKDQPPQVLPPPGDLGEGGVAPEGGGEQPLPKPLPENPRSPFEMDRPDNGAQPPPGRGGAARPGAAPPADAEPSPFETPAPRPSGGGATPGTTPRGTQPGQPATGLPNAGSPNLDAPNAPAAARNDPQTESDRSDRAPLLATADATLPPVEEVGGASQPSTTESVLGGPAATAPVANSANAQSQPRRSRLGAFFSGLGLNWLRR